MPLKGSIRVPLRGSVKGSIGFQGLGLRAQCRSLIKKPWAFIAVPHMDPTILWVTGPGFLNQVPTLTVFGLGI